MTKYPPRGLELPPPGSDSSHRPEPQKIGRSRDGRPIFAYRIGDGPVRVSLVGGCHADEPVGPRFLRRMVGFLAGEEGSALRDAATWLIIPHINPDGAALNAAWQTPGADRYDFVAYLRHRVRELPGDDIEFGFPHGEDDLAARPENRAAWDFWRAHAPFDLHVSMHGMSVAAGPYFLVERSWWPRFGEAAGALTREVEAAGYTLHDVERHGEKGFHRLARGFCSRPDSGAMRRHFLDLGDPGTAARFRPSSMEAVRALGGDTLTLVTEMPLFITPGVGAELGPPDPVLMRWRERIAGWEARIRGAVGEAEAARVQAAVREEAAQAGLRAMPVPDQMRFQWALIRVGLGVVGGRWWASRSMPEAGSRPGPESTAPLARCGDWSRRSGTRSNRAKGWPTAGRLRPARAGSGGPPRAPVIPGGARRRATHTREYGQPIMARRPPVPYLFRSRRGHPALRELRDGGIETAPQNLIRLIPA